MLIEQQKPRAAAAGATSVLRGWSDREIFAIRECLLYETMAAAVDGRSSRQTREEAWDWIEADDEHPFSFRVCAMAIGADPDVLRMLFRLESSRLDA